MAPTNKEKSWSSADQAKLKDLAGRNTPTGVIAMKLGRSEQAVRSQAQGCASL
jgi:hypothetical protein